MANLNILLTEDRETCQQKQYYLFTYVQNAKATAN